MIIKEGEKVMIIKDIDLMVIKMSTDFNCFYFNNGKNTRLVPRFHGWLELLVASFKIFYIYIGGFFAPTILSCNIN